MWRGRAARWAIAVACLAALGIAAATALQASRRHAATGVLLQRLALLVPPAPVPTQPCAAAGGERPWMLLVLGQSNAGNHGGGDLPAARRGPPLVDVFVGDGCQRLGDPLPGATGRHHSIWSRLPQALAERGVQRQVVVSLLAVDGSRIADWSQRDGPLQRELQHRLGAMRDAGMMPDRVLWQHGESDALEGTSAMRYARGLQTVRRVLRDAGVTAPIVVARSTHCGRGDGSAVRRALHALQQRHRDVLEGPDTDRLVGPSMRLGCHFTEAGLRQAAALWAETLAPQNAVMAPRH